MAKLRDKTEVVVEKRKRGRPRRTPRPLRYIEVITGWRSESYYRVRAGTITGKILYHSEYYASTQGARVAATREHEGRSKFEYILVWTDGRTGKVNRETL